MNKRNLNEVTIIRPIVILLLVIMHSFTPYGGGWSLPNGIDNVDIYFWVQKITYSSMLETFVFISGYIFAYQIYEQKRQFTLKSIVANKFKRLIVPCIVFSVVQLLLFGTNNDGLLKLSYRVICGVAHLWFLPMLFWCFIATYFLVRLKIREEVKLVLLFLLSSVSFVPLPVQLTKTMYYLFFFYGALYIWRHRTIIEKNFVNLKTIVVGFIVFLFLFISLVLFKENLQLYETHTIIEKAFVITLSKLAQLLYSSVGLLLLYIFVLYIIKGGVHIPAWLVKLNTLCMGIYIFHHYILQYIYYRTQIPILLGTYWLPWVGLVISLILSVLLAVILRRFRLGRILI